MQGIIIIIKINCFSPPDDVEQEQPNVPEEDDFEIDGDEVDEEEVDT